MAAEIRQAALDDAGDILDLLLSRAADIPLLADTLAREEALYAQLRNCARSGESWVACGGDGRIVAAAVAELAQHGRHYAEREVIELRYAVSAAGTGEDTLDALIAKVQGRMVPATAAISPQNRTGLAACLERLGFRPAGEQRWLWDP